MNTPAQCGVIKPPKTDIYSEAPHTPNTKRPTNPFDTSHLERVLIPLAVPQPEPDRAAVKTLSALAGVISG